MNCTNCGARLDDSVLFCAECGTPVNRGSQQNAAVEPTVVMNGTNMAAQQTNGNDAPKKPKKKSKLPIIIAILLVLGIGIGGVVVLTSRNNDSATETSKKDKDSDKKNKDDSSAEEDNQDNKEEEDSSAKSEEEAKKAEEEKKAKEVEQILNDAEALAENKQYSEAILKLEAGLAIYSDVKEFQTKKDEYTVSLEEQKKQVLLDNASAYALGGDYVSALNLLKEAQEKDPTVTEYKEHYEKYCELYEKSVLLEVENLALTQDYEAVIVYIDEALVILDKNENLTAARKTYVDLMNEPLIESALSEAATLGQNGDNLAALQWINQAIKDFGETEKLLTAVQTYTDAYVDVYIEQVTALLSASKVTEAKKMIEDAPQEIAENTRLLELKGNIEKYKVMYLQDMESFKSYGWKSYSDVVEDTVGTTYPSDVRHFVWRLDSSDNHYVQYRTDYQYNELSMTVAPWKDFDTSRSAYIIVHVNGDVRYISPEISYGTKPFEIRVDVSDAEYVMIETVFDYSYGSYPILLMTDMKFTYLGLETGPVKKDYVAFDSLEVLNGGFNFENDFPTDTWQTKYNDVINYSVLAGQYSHSASREVFIGGEYASYSMDIAAYKYSKETSVKIYADDKCVYSVSVNQKTKRFNTGDIDMTGVNFIRVEVEGYNSGVILSKMILKKSSEENAESTEEITE